MDYFIGVDVGTGSARAGIFDSFGKMYADSTVEIDIFNPKTNFYMQSSDNIWNSVTTCIRKILIESKISTSQIKGIGFDATCSLVVLDSLFNPISVSENGENRQNIILWMDHRAEEYAQKINSIGGEPLKYIGGKISSEMQLPKLLWLKNYLPKSWEAAHHFFDLPDFLTFQATGSLSRSMCSTVCKWTYLGQSGQGWDAQFLKRIGLEELTKNKFSKIGSKILPIGKVAGKLSELAAKQMNLKKGIPVGVSVIDAHAGGIGILGGKDK